jgi:hypothetical protein
VSGSRNISLGGRITPAEPTTPSAPSGQPAPAGRPAESPRSRELPGFVGNAPQRTSSGSMAPRGMSPLRAAAPAGHGQPPTRLTRHDSAPAVLQGSASPLPRPQAQPAAPARPQHAATWPGPATGAKPAHAKPVRSFSLSKMLGREEKPAPVAIELAAMDLFEGIDIPASDRQRWMLRVSADQPELIGDKPHAQKDMLLQRMTLTAYSTMSQGRQELRQWLGDQAAVRATLRTPQQLKAHDQAVRIGSEQRVAALRAQVQQGTSAELAQQLERDKALSDSNSRFAWKAFTGGVSLTANVAAAATGGTLPMNVIMATKAAVGLAKEISSFAKGASEFEKSILKNDAGLAKLREPAAARRSSFAARLGAREIGSALGLPGASSLMKSVRAQRQELEEFRARSTRMEGGARKLQGELQKVLQYMDEQRAAGQPIDPKQEQALDAVLNSLSDLNATLAAHEAFYQAQCARCDAYEKDVPPPADKAADGIETLREVGSAVALANSLRQLSALLPL